MKTREERIKLEKKFWNLIADFCIKQGSMPNWEVAGNKVSKKWFLVRLEKYHETAMPYGFYGLSVPIGKIGNQQVWFTIEMQSQVVLGIRFDKKLIPWTPREERQFEEFDASLGGSMIDWVFDTLGWLAWKNLAVKIDFRNPENKACIDFHLHKDEGYAMLLIREDLADCFRSIKSGLTHKKRNLVWNHY